MAIQCPQLNYFKLVIEYPNMVLPSVLIFRCAKAMNLIYVFIRQFAVVT